MSRRQVKDDRQEPQFGYDRSRADSYSNEPRAYASNRTTRVRRRQRSIIPLFLVGAVIILFGGFLWISYVRGPKLVGGQLPVITADTTPIKVKPDKPGGAEIPFQNTTVYDDLGKQKHQTQEVEHLLEPPEQPLPMVPPVTETATPAPVPTTPLAEAVPDIKAPPAEALPPPPSSQEDAVPSITPTNEAALAPPSDSPPIAAPVVPVPAPTVTAPKPETAVSKPKPPASPATGARNSMLQLGSFKDEAAAKAEWQRLKNRYSDQLSALSPTVLRVDLGDKGIWYRLRAGSLTADKAKAACTYLTNEKAPCIVRAR